MRIEDILTNLEITCGQNNISTQDVVLLYVMDKLNIIDYGDDLQYQLNKFRLDLQEEHDLLWDLQPELEDDEDHAFAVQHARDIYNVLVGRELC
jgi:hypothetical protein